MITQPPRRWKPLIEGRGAVAPQSNGETGKKKAESGDSELSWWEPGKIGKNVLTEHWEIFCNRKRTKGRESGNFRSKTQMNLNLPF